MKGMEEFNYTDDEISAILEKDYGQPIINKTTVQYVKSNPFFYRGHVLTMIGNLYTDREWKERQDSILDHGWI